MKSVINLYKNAFGGLSPAAWMLALVILINRSGTMVIPFLSVYLTSSLGFTLVETGWVMSAFGLGAICGSFLGGWLTDKIGNFKIQTFSLIGGGCLFFALSQVKEFYPLTIFIFCVSVVTEMMRPANQISVASYAKPENVTRAFSLNRMAINLGFSFGPALGGLLAAISYDSLFIADGVTCISAGLVFFFYFRHKQPRNTPNKSIEEPAERSVWKDYQFLLFILLVMGFAMMFFQLFTTWPIYHREQFQLSEQEIGILLGLNGFIVFFFEMILVYKIGERIPIHRLIVFGTVLNALAFFCLFTIDAKIGLYLACVIISFAEIFAMPFMVTHTVHSSGKRNKGAYMGLYSVGFASAFMFAPLVGTNLVAKIGFHESWLYAGVFGLFVAIGFYFSLRRKRSKES
ncbi:MDR family MFS transporter [Marinoscillum sp.]|uniref:MDR family MFS transporter n=1 Tax=Marinoscillum sp. TaxID=2024838 RepID=UPI003BAC8C81